MHALHLRISPTLIPPKDATWRQRHRVPWLSRTETRGSTGHACVQLAMVVMRLAAADGAIGVFDEWAETDGHRIEPTCQEMLSFLEKLHPALRYRTLIGSMHAVRRFATDRLKRNELVLIETSEWGKATSHWVLGVGTEVTIARNGASVTGLLCLDPAGPEPPLVPFNTRLDLASPSARARYAHYRTGSSIRNVTCVSAIALSTRH